MASLQLAHLIAVIARGTNTGMTKSKIEKISVSLDRDLLRWLRGRAEARGLSLSALLNEAAMLQRQMEARSRVVELLDLPEASAEELSQLEHELQGKLARPGPVKSVGPARAGARKIRRRA
jgi:hypothetical protein